MTNQPAPFPPTPYRVTVSVELAEGSGWSLVELHAVDSNAFLALHTAAAAAEEALHVHPTTRDGRMPGRHTAEGIELRNRATRAAGMIRRTFSDDSLLAAAVKARS